MSPVHLDLTSSDYEDEVAELLARKFEGTGTVERDVRLKSKSGVRARQIDILVRVPLPDMDDHLIVVDCKRYGHKVNAKDVEAFIGMIDDIGVGTGLLVTTEGYTGGAKRRAAAARDIRIQVIPLEELPVWEPPLISCTACADSVPEESLPGMAYIDRVRTVYDNDGEGIEVTLGYCERCDELYFECPTCGALNEARDGEMDGGAECAGGCGLTYVLRPMQTKDDLSNPTHDRLTLNP